MEIPQPPPTDAIKKMEPAVGVEPTTRSLQNCCSATELSWHRTPKNAAFRRLRLTPSLSLGFHRIFAGTPRSGASVRLRRTHPCAYCLFDFNNPKNAAFRHLRLPPSPRLRRDKHISTFHHVSRPAKPPRATPPIANAIGVSRSRRSAVSPSGVSPAFLNITPRRSARNLRRGRFSEKSA